LSGKPNTGSTSITPDGDIYVKQTTKSNVLSEKVTEKARASYGKKTQSGATSSPSDKTGTQAIRPVGTTKPPANSKVAKPPSQQIRNNTRQDDMEDLVLPINLLEMAKNAWKERYGTDLPHTIPIGDSFKKIGTVWTQSINEPDKPSVYTTTEYPPSVLDESFKSHFFSTTKKTHHHRFLSSLSLISIGKGSYCRLQRAVIGVVLAYFRGDGRGEGAGCGYGI
jgi:hypothetical protein